MLSSEMLLLPTMISESKAETEKLSGGKRNERNDRQSDVGGVSRRPTVGALKTPTHSVAPHSLLAAESEDATDVERQPAEVPAVQADPDGLVVQFTQRQGHSAEVQQATTERHT